MENIRKAWQLVSGGLRYDPIVFLLLTFHTIVPTKVTQVHEISVDRILNLIAAGHSFIRLGDGEAMIMTGRDVYFQPTSHFLAKRLRLLVTNYNNDARYILGVPTNKLPLSETQLSQKERKVWRLYRTLFPIRFPTDVSYAPLTFFYVKDRFKVSVAPLLSNRHVVCVSNNGVLDVAFRTYATAAFTSVAFVTTPAYDAAATEDRIRQEIDTACVNIAHLPVTILFAAGPASKVWAHDYTLQGIQCLDIGHGMELIAQSDDRSHKI